MNSDVNVQRSVSVAAEIAIEAECGWTCHRVGDVHLWFKGWIAGVAPQDLAAFLAEGAPTPDRLGGYLRQVDGHFAFAAAGNGWAVAAVDAFDNNYSPTL